MIKIFSSSNLILSFIFEALISLIFSLINFTETLSFSFIFFDANLITLSLILTLPLSIVFLINERVKWVIFSDKKTSSLFSVSLLSIENLIGLFIINIIDYNHMRS